MKEKAGGLVGTILGIVGYFFLKELFVNLGVNSFLSIILAVIALIAIVVVVFLVIGFLSNALKSDEQKAKEKKLQDEYAQEIARKIKEEK